MPAQELPVENDQLELVPDLPPGVEPEDGGASTRHVRRSAVEQGSNIPLGWKPSVQKPVPVVRCAYVWPDEHPRGGDRCGRWSLRGSRLCFKHSGSGNLKNVEEYRQAVLEAARLTLVESAPDAVAVLIDLAANAGQDNVRLKAATEVLDRTGIRGGFELTADLTVTEVSPQAVLAERLQKLRAAADLTAAREAQAEAEAADAPVSDQPSAQLALPVGEARDHEAVEGEIVEDEKGFGRPNV